MYIVHCTLYSVQCTAYMNIYTCIVHIQGAYTYTCV